MGVGPLAVADEPRGSTGEEPGAPVLWPNPLGTGDIKLTLPGRSAPEPVPPPAAAAPEEEQAQEPPAAEAEPDAEPPANGEDSPDESPAPAVGYAGFGSDDAARRPDRKVVQVLTGVVALVVLLGAVVWWFSRPPQAPPAPAGRPVALPTGAPLPDSAAPVVEDAPLPITITADCPDQTDPKLAASTDPRSAWVCPTQGVPFGQKLTIVLPKPYVITGIQLWPGFQGTGPDGRDEWFRHSLLRRAQLVFNDVDRTLVEVTPQGERREYSKPVNHILASSVELTVLETSPPPPEPQTTATQAPAGSDPADTDAPPPPDLGALFPPPGPDADAANNPNAASVAIWGLKLIGHPVP